MPLNSIPHLSLGSAVLLIFALCLTLVLLRGMARILTGTVILAISGWIGLTVWHISPGLSLEFFGKPVNTFVIGLPILSFAVTFWLLVKALQFILLPLDCLRSDDKPKTSLPTGLIVAIIPSAILFLLTASLLHHFGAIEEIRSYATAPNADKPTHARAFLRSCKSSLDTFLPEKVLRHLDPATDPSRIQTAKLITRRSNQPYTPEIDPATGKPYPRAIIVDDPELQNLAREGKFGTLLRHPVLTKASQDPSVQKLLHHFNLK